MDTLCNLTTAPVQTSGRYESPHGQEEVKNSESTKRNAIKKDADDITPHICKSLAGKADACNIEGVKSLADDI